LHVSRFDPLVVERDGDLYEAAGRGEIPRKLRFVVTEKQPTSIATGRSEPVSGREFHSPESSAFTAHCFNNHVRPCRTMPTGDCRGIAAAPGIPLMHSALRQTDFQRYWAGEYPACPPIGFLLRAKYNDKWFRIHSLPGSKRYPENDAEMRDVLHRHNAVLDALLRPDGAFVLLTTDYSNEPTPVLPRLLRTDSTLNLSSTFAFTASSDAGSPFWHFFVTALKWHRGCLDAVLAQVATDAIADILVIGQEQKCVYHPYDGGGDIIVRSDEGRTTLKQMFSAWLSPRADGL
jgi:hypothetical protein